MHATTCWGARMNDCPSRWCCECGLKTVNKIHWVRQQPKLMMPVNIRTMVLQSGPPPNRWSEREFRHSPRPASEEHTEVNSLRFGVSQTWIQILLLPCSLLLYQVSCSLETSTVTCKVRREPFHGMMNIRWEEKENAHHSPHFSILALNESKWLLLHWVVYRKGRCTWTS